MKRTYISRIFFTGFVLVGGLLSTPMNSNALPKNSVKTINLLQNSEVKSDKSLDCNSARTMLTGYHLDTSFVEVQFVQLIAQADHQEQDSSINGTYIQVEEGISSSNYLQALITNSNQQGFRFKLDLARNNPNCLGEISGYARWIGNNVAEIAEIDDEDDLSSCYIEFTFNDNQISMREALLGLRG